MTQHHGQIHTNQPLHVHKNSKGIDDRWGGARTCVFSFTAASVRYRSDPDPHLEHCQIISDSLSTLLRISRLCWQELIYQE